MAESGIDIFHTTPCLSMDQLYRYAEDNLSGNERHHAEKHLLECELCAFAVEEVAHQPRLTLEAITASVNKKIAGYGGRAMDHRNAAWMWRAAAGVAVLLALSATWWWLSTDRVPETGLAESGVYQPRATSPMLSPTAVTPVADSLVQATDSAANTPTTPPATRPQIATTAPAEPAASEATPDPLVAEELPTSDTVSTPVPTPVINRSSPPPAPRPQLSLAVRQRENLGLRKRKNRQQGQAYGTLNSFVPEGMPQFSGGDAALLSTLQQNLNLSDQEKANWHQQVAQVQITVDAKGKVDEVSVVQGSGSGFEQRVLEATKALPAWQPGTQKGKKGRIRYTLEVWVQ